MFPGSGCTSWKIFPCRMCRPDGTTWPLSVAILQEANMIRSYFMQSTESFDFLFSFFHHLSTEPSSSRDINNRVHFFTIRTINNNPFYSTVQHTTMQPPTFLLYIACLDWPVVRGRHFLHFLYPFSEIQCILKISICYLQMTPIMTLIVPILPFLHCRGKNKCRQK